MRTRIKHYANTSLGVTSAFKHFLDNPVSFGLKFLVIVLIIEVVLTGVGEVLKINSLRYTYDIVESLFYILLAWILLSGAINRIAVGVFLLLVFALSIFFLIVPMDAAAALLKKTVDPGNGTVFIYSLLMGALGSSIVITRQYIRDFESRDVESWC